MFQHCYLQEPSNVSGCISIVIAGSLEKVDAPSSSVLPSQSFLNLSFEQHFRDIRDEDLETSLFSHLQITNFSEF